MMIDYCIFTFMLFIIKMTLYFTHFWYKLSHYFHYWVCHSTLNSLKEIDLMISVYIFSVFMILIWMFLYFCLNVVMLTWIFFRIFRTRLSSMIMSVIYWAILTYSQIYWRILIILMKMNNSMITFFIFSLYILYQYY